MNKDLNYLFESTLHIPSIKPYPQFFLCPAGYIGAGKSTVMRLLCEELSAIRIENDYARKLLRERDNHDSNHARALSKDFILKYAELGYRVGIDANCAGPNRHASGSIEEIAIDLSIPIVWIHINPPEEFIIRKLKQYSIDHPEETWLFKDGDHAVSRYYHWKERSHFENIDYAYEFDTSRSDINDQVAAAAVVIQRRFSASDSDLKND
ncbi:MAG: ATP-binding protein [bacterium]|nr:ATP-binding protein [bacterium]